MAGEEICAALRDHGVDIHSGVKVTAVALRLLEAYEAGAPAGPG